MITCPVKCGMKLLSHSQIMNPHNTEWTGWILTGAQIGGLVAQMANDVEWVLNVSWWRHQMETFSALLAIYAGNSTISGEFLTQRPVTRSFDVFFDLCLNKWLSKQWWSWWFETPSCSLWRHCNVELRSAHVTVTCSGNITSTKPWAIFQKIAMHQTCHSLQQQNIVIDNNREYDFNSIFQKEIVWIWN